MAITNPRDIPDLLAWYSAEAETTYADGAAMTAWTDQSGNGNHATAVGSLAPQWQATSGPSGGPSVNFRGTAGSSSDSTRGYFQLPNVFTGATAGEMAVYLKSGRATSVVNASWAFGSTADESYYTFSNGTIYEFFGSTVRKGPITPTLSVTSWRRLDVWSSANDWGLLLDQTSQSTTTSNAVSFDSAPIIGDSKFSGSVAAGSYSSPFNGQISAVILYSRKLTATERADLDAWMVANPSGGAAPAPPPGGAISLAGTLPAIQSSMTLASYTDTATDNRANGRLRGGGFIDESEEPVSPLPANLVRAVKVDKAFAYPTPTLVDGRPT